MRAEPEVAPQHLGRAHRPSPARSRSGRRCSRAGRRSMATQPMPPSLMAILRVGMAQGRSPDHSHSAQAVSDSWPNSVAPSCRASMPAPGGAGLRPELPTWSETTVSVSTHGLDDRVPVVPVPQRGQPDLVRPLGEGHRGEAPRGVAADLGHGERRVGQVGDPERDDAIGVRASTTPRRASRSRPGRRPGPRSRSGRRRRRGHRSR